MECKAQSYWHSEYKEYQLFIITAANSSYKRFAKRQFHKSRRQYDKRLIDEHLSHMNDNRTMTMRSFSSKIWKPVKEHDHTFKVKDICTNFARNQ